MENCANCKEWLCDEGEILQKIENFEYDEVIDGWYCFDIECKNCGYENAISASIEVQITGIEVE